ncbi:neutral alpha-glucosidase AB-like, partial [Anoplophora glabripennis]|uniref:neutral alpha-glucosidase AB-like n=1 Tax=Anoplophora glabripennis TaxID=217634 RepID=UPI000C75A7B3
MGNFILRGIEIMEKVSENQIVNRPVKMHRFLGTDILARPVFEESATKVTVTLPGEEPALWYRVDDESWTSYSAGTELEIDVDISASPFFYRGGSIISRKDREKGSTTDMVDDPFTVYVNLDA